MHTRTRWKVVLSAFLGWTLPWPAPAQVPFLPQPALDWQRPILPTDRIPDLFSPASPEPTPTLGPRVRLPGFQPGFLVDPPGEPDDPDGPDWLNVWFGEDNPWVDFRSRPQFGGPGYFRFNSQVALFDSPATSCVLALQALSPAGIAFDGLPDKAGPRLVLPALSVYRALDETTAIQGFVRRPVQVGRNPQTYGVNENLQCGVSVHRPLLLEAPDLLRELYISLGAVGQMRGDGPALSRPMTWDVLPGFHWKLADRWSLFGAVNVPLTTLPRLENGAWQVMCSWQY